MTISIPNPVLVTRERPSGSQVPVLGSSPVPVFPAEPSTGTWDPEGGSRVTSTGGLIFFRSNRRSAGLLKTHILLISKEMNQIVLGAFQEFKWKYRINYGYCGSGQDDEKYHDVVQEMKNI
jgi:hypothetical protein